MDVAGLRIVVIGLGVSGRAVAKLLARRGARVLVSDVAPEPVIPVADASLEQYGVVVETGGHSRTLLDGADLVVLSPGVNPSAGPAAEALKRDMKVVSEIEVASWYFDGSIAGITGSNGKSTTTAMAAEMMAAGGLEVAAGGNLGYAFSAIVDEKPAVEVIVLELSSFQLEQIDTFRAETGVLLNVTPDHLDRHPTVESYEAAKARLWEGQRNGDWAIYGADDPGASRLTREVKGTKIPFSLVGREGSVGAWIEERGGQSFAMAALPDQEEPRVLFDATEVPLPGSHNLANALAAAVVARRYGIDPDAISEGLRQFKGLPHRLEMAGEIGEVSFWNDSKATNVESARAALTGFDSGVVLIAGGKYKGISFDPLRDELSRCGIAAVLIGEARPHLLKDLDGIVPLYQEESLEAAVDKAYRLARPRGVVLLAPACSSFDMFTNYEERGDLFKETVRGLIAVESERE